MLDLVNPLAAASIACAVFAASIMIWYLVKKPALITSTKVILLFGILVFPVGAALSGNVHGYTISQKREFCGNCHVMTPYTGDAAAPESQTLAARHGKNHWFGDQNCYTCHADYGMFGTVATKINGLKHMWMYFALYYDVPLEESLYRIQLYKPFSNQACLQCHSTRTKAFSEVKDHKGAEDDVRAGNIGCASEGCHGPAHPFSKKKKNEVSEVAR